MKAIEVAKLELHCDSCGHNEPMDASTKAKREALVGTPCPMCGANLLTATDQRSMERILKVVGVINTCFAFLVKLGLKVRPNPERETFSVNAHDNELRIRKED